MLSVARPNSLRDLDPRLLEEAFRRARRAKLNETINSAALLAAIIDEARRGTRDMHGLVSAAGHRAIGAR